MEAAVATAPAILSFVLQGTFPNTFIFIRTFGLVPQIDFVYDFPNFCDERETSRE